MSVHNIRGIMYDLNSVTVRFSESIHEPLDKHVREKWKELCRTAPKEANASPLIPFDEWQKTVEGRVHFGWLQKYFYSAGKLSSRDATNMANRLQSQRYQLRGKTRLHSPLLYSKTSYRAFKVWYVNKLLAQALSVPFTDECPIIVATPTQDNKLTYCQMADRFEEFSRERLPTEAWETCKKLDAAAMADLRLAEIKEAA